MSLNRFLQVVTSIALFVFVGIVVVPEGATPILEFFGVIVGLFLLFIYVAVYGQPEGIVTYLAPARTFFVGGWVVILGFVGLGLSLALNQTLVVKVIMLLFLTSGACVVLAHLVLCTRLGIELDRSGWWR